MSQARTFLQMPWTVRWSILAIGLAAFLGSARFPGIVWTHFLSDSGWVPLENWVLLLGLPLLPVTLCVLAAPFWLWLARERLERYPSRLAAWIPLVYWLIPLAQLAIPKVQVRWGYYVAALAASLVSCAMLGRPPKVDPETRSYGFPLRINDSFEKGKK